MTAAAATQPNPITLVRPADDPGTAATYTPEPFGGVNWIGFTIFLIVAIIVAGTLHIRHLLKKRSPVEDRAFRALADQLRLKPADRRAIRAAATLIEAKPVALLASDAALRNALRRADRLDRAHAERLQRLAAGDESPLAPQPMNRVA